MKISIIGAGNVGATTAMRLLEADIADIILVDIAENIAKGKAEDLMDAASLIGHGRQIVGTSDYKLTENSDIVVITAGFARKPGMSREELLNKNGAIVTSVARSVIEHSPNPIIIVVTNPLDVMTYAVQKASGLDSSRVLGMAGALDSSRMDLMAARSLNRRVPGIDSLVLGTHGETMAPTTSHSQVDGNPISDTLAPEAIEQVIQKTKARGAEIVSYLGTGSAYYAPSAGVFKMVQSIVEDKGEIIPSSCLLTGQYGVEGIYLGVPARLGKSGIKEIVELPLTGDEQTLLQKAADSVRGMVQLLA
jgi:malate dehydrogenase